MKRIIALMLMAVMALTCASFASAENALTTVTYFGSNAMAGSGELTGEIGKFFNERGLNIEVVPYSTEKLQAQLASGDLADVIYLTQKDMQIAAESGLILPLDEYIEKMPNVVAHAELFDPSFAFAREHNSNGTGNLYYLGRVGQSSLNVAPDTDRNAIKMNWAIYAEAGYPEFATLEDVIPVLKKMQELRPTSADGLPTYGMNMFSDFDTEYFYNMYSVYCLLGKQADWLGYGVEYDVATQTGYSIFTEGSAYYRGLKFMYEMNQAGLMDPDSLSQTRSTAWTKIHTGAALAGWASDPGLETDGYYPVMFDEFLPTYSTAQSFPTGGYCISANCQNIDAALKLLDTLCCEEDLLFLFSGAPGDDKRWNYDPETGIPTITQAYIDSVNAGAPMETEFWNITYPITNGYILDVGTSYSYTYFPSYFDITYSTELAKDWTNHYGYTYLRKLIDDKNWPVAEQTEGFTSFLTPDDDIMALTKASLKDVIVPASWRMVFAADEAEFDAIWADTKAKCESLGIDYVVQYKLDDIAAARETWNAITK